MMASLITHILAFGDDVLRRILVSTLQLREVVRFESAIVNKGLWKRITNLARNFHLQVVTVTYLNVNELVWRNASIIEVVFGPSVGVKEMILVSEILSSTRCIKFDFCEKINDDAIAAIVRGAPALESLYIDDAKLLTDKALESIAAHCPRLMTLELQRTACITRSAMQTLCRACSELETLVVYPHHRTHVPDILSDVAPYCDNLKTLRATVGDAGYRTIGDFAQLCAKLTNLECRSAFILPEDVDAIIQHRPLLQSLHLNGTLYVGWHQIIELAEHCTALTSLGLSNTVPEAALDIFGINCGTGLQRLKLKNFERPHDLSVIVRYCFNLTEVDFSYSSGVNDNTMLLLAEQNPSLQVVEVDGCFDLTDFAICALADHCPQLRSLQGVANSYIRPSTIVYLAQRCSQIQELCRWAAQMNDDVVNALASHCPRLSIVHIQGRRVTNQALVALARACPELEALRLERGPHNLANKALIKALAQHCKLLKLVRLGCCDLFAKFAIKALVQERLDRGLFLDIGYTARLF